MYIKYIVYILLFHVKYETSSEARKQLFSDGVREILIFQSWRMEEQYFTEDRQWLARVTSAIGHQASGCLFIIRT